MKKVGIIGYGRFGQILGELLSKKYEILVTDSNSELNVNIKFSPLSINSLCKYINLIIRKKVCGTFNIGSKKGITKSKLANIFAENLKLDTSSIKEINYTKKYSIAKRPLDMRLNSSFFEKKINIKTKNTLSEIKLIIKDYMINNMQTGSVIYDLAAVQGGNTAFTEIDKIVDKNGIKIIGERNILNKLPVSASNLYAKNVFNFISNLYDKDNKKLKINLEDEIINKTLLK